MVGRQLFKVNFGPSVPRGTLVQTALMFHVEHFVGTGMYVQNGGSRFGCCG